MLVRKTFKFEAAHRLINSYTERCRGIHGHSYKVELLVEGAADTTDGMVVDFTLLKERFGSFLDMFDHSLILFKHDPLVTPERYPPADAPIPGLAMLNPRYIVFPQHPTAEMMAEYFYWKAYESLTTHKYRVHAVRVHETETGWAECRALDQTQEFVEENWLRGVKFSDKCKGGFK